MWPFRRQRRDVVQESSPDQRFRRFGGRQHLAGLPYPLPKDMDEVNRLDFQHFLLRTGLRGNYAAPIGQQPTDILDVGCGSGRWAMEMAAQFPNARVVGLDLVPPPDEGKSLGHGLDTRPSNYLFAVGNILEGLPFPDASFDFVHQRLLITAIPRDRWPAVIQELARVTRPGGWVELAECGSAQDGGPGYMGLWQSWIDFLAARNVDFTMGKHIGQVLTSGGLANVQQRVLNFPMGNWGGRIGRASATDCLAVGKALRAGIIAQGILSAEQYDALYARAEREFAQSQGRGILPFYVTCGQRIAV
ncbi:MAG TPA: methyltransferase domain-containing protein [Ktedonobacterales bacterium]|nr:methyltransferase domain-containing protein [Ktedonobacterales bacterium]